LLLFSTAEEPSSVASCERSSPRDGTEEGFSAVVIFNCGRTLFRELIYFFGFKIFGLFCILYFTITKFNIYLIQIIITK